MRKGDRFNAYTRQYGNLACGAPFRFEEYDWHRTESRCKIIALYAKDKFGHDRRFMIVHKNMPWERTQDWTFVIEKI